MSGTVKCIIAGVILAIIGTAVLLTGFALNDWRFPASQEVTIQTYYAQQDNNALAIQISSGTVKTEYYDGEKINIEFPSSKNYRNQRNFAPFDRTERFSVVRRVPYSAHDN